MSRFQGTPEFIGYIGVRCEQIAHNRSVDFSCGRLSSDDRLLIDMPRAKGRAIHPRSLPQREIFQ